MLAGMAVEKEAVPAVLRRYGSEPASAAFYLAEATKARSLVESLASAARQAHDPQQPEALRDEETALRYRLAALESQWTQAYERGGTAWEAYQTQLETLTLELDGLIARLRREYPLYAALHYPQPVPAHELPLADDEVLLECTIGEDTSYAFIVRRGGVMQVVVIPLGREALEAEVRAFMAAAAGCGRTGAGFSTRRAKGAV